MQTRRTLAAWMMLIALALAACAPARTASPTLNDTGWILVNLGGEAVLSDTQVTLAFQSGQISGTDGCNRYSGRYTRMGARLMVDKDIATTQMACAEPIMQQAARYVAALTQSTEYKNEGQQLRLLDARGRTLATFARQRTELGETAWSVTGYNNGKQAVVSVVGGTQLTAAFGADGKLSGSAGCNDYTGAYELSGQTIKIGPLASTRKLCADPAGTMDQETQYLKALGSAATYRLEGNTLELRTADGALAVTCTRTGGGGALAPQAPHRGTALGQAAPHAD